MSADLPPRPLPVPMSAARKGPNKPFFFAMCGVVVLAITTVLFGVAARSGHEQSLEDMKTISESEATIAELEESNGKLEERLASAQTAQKRAENALESQNDLSARKDAVLAAETAAAEREAAVQAREDAVKASEEAARTNTEWWISEVRECLARPGDSYRMASVTLGSGLGNDVSCMTG